MSEPSSVHDVASGVPYVVRSVNGHPPASLDDFTSSPVVALVVELRGQVIEIHGDTRVDGGAVLVYEKSAGGTGKDVRTWRVVEVDDRFEIAERSLY